MSTPHKCSECGEVVLIEVEVITRTCDHTEAPIIAEMEAVAYGVGGLQE